MAARVKRIMELPTRRLVLTSVLCTDLDAAMRAVPRTASLIACWSLSVPLFATVMA